MKKKERKNEQREKAQVLKKEQREKAQALRLVQKNEAIIRRNNAFIESQKLSTDVCIIFWDEFKKNEQKILNEQKNYKNS